MRAQLTAMDDPVAIRAELAALAGAPPGASVREFALHLGRLALHFWRPDFTPDQAKVLYGDFVRLLEGCTADELGAACDEWIMDPRNRFFPTPGMLHDRMKERLRDRAKARASAAYLASLLDEARDEAPRTRRRSVADVLGETS